MAFKIKDSLQIGTVTAFNSSGILQTAALATGVVSPSTYTSVTVDTYGRVTGGSNPTSAATLQNITDNGATTTDAVTISNATAGGAGAGALILSAGGMSVNGAIYAGSLQATPIGGTTRAAGAFTTLDANNAVGLSPANQAVTISPTGTGTVTINPATVGAIDKVNIGANTRGTGAFTTLAANSTVTLSPASANVAISPTGTGTVTISPAAALTINPTAVSAMDNVNIGANTKATGAFTSLTANAAVTFTQNTTSTTTGTGTLVVTGGVGISENLNVGGNLILTGNLTVNGATNTINSTTLVVEDPIINLGGGANGAAPVADDAKDRGIEFQWYDTQARTGFFGFDRSTGYFTFIPQATLTSEVVSGTQGDIQATNFRGALIGNADTATKTATARSITMSADVSWTVNFDGSGNVTAAATLATVCASPGTFSSVVVNGKGLVTSGSNPGYLTAEVDTLANVTSRGNTTATAIQMNGVALVLAPATTAKIWILALAPTLISVNTISTIDTFATATYRSAKYLIQIVQGTKYQISELRICHDGTTVYLTEFGVVETNAGAPIPCTYTAAIATGTLTVSDTITDAASTNANLIMERTLFSA